MPKNKNVSVKEMQVGPLVFEGLRFENGQYGVSFPQLVRLFKLSVAPTIPEVQRILVHTTEPFVAFVRPDNEANSVEYLTLGQVSTYAIELAWLGNPVAIAFVEGAIREALKRSVTFSAEQAV